MSINRDVLVSLCHFLLSKAHGVKVVYSLPSVSQHSLMDDVETGLNFIKEKITLLLGLVLSLASYTFTCTFDFEL